MVFLGAVSPNSSLLILLLIKSVDYAELRAVASGCYSHRSQTV